MMLRADRQLLEVLPAMAADVSKDFEVAAQQDVELNKLMRAFLDVDPAAHMTRYGLLQELERVIRGRVSSTARAISRVATEHGVVVNDDSYDDVMADMRDMQAEFKKFLEAYA